MRRWDELAPAFASLGVQFLAISPDTPAEAARFTAKHELRVRILTDEALAVADLYNVRSQKTLALGLGRSVVRPLVIPTTLLVDERGMVRWIDQADDYRVRSDATRVLDRVRSALK